MEQDTVEQGGFVYDCVDEPEQVAPPPDGAGFVQVRVWVPEYPQELFFALQSVQPPLITGAQFIVLGLPESIALAPLELEFIP